MQLYDVGSTSTDELQHNIEEALWTGVISGGTQYTSSLLIDVVTAFYADKNLTNGLQ